MIDPPDSFGVLFCLDAASGHQLWSVDKIHGKEMKGFFSSPAVTADGRFVVIGQGLHPDSNCQLTCADAQSGRIAWTLQVPMHIESSPVIDGDMIYVGVGAIEDPATHKPISHPGFVIAVRISDGKEIWRHDVADPESSPVVKDGVVFIGSGFNGNAVVALRTGTDEELKKRGETRELWKTATPYPITGAITLLGDAVITGGGNGDFVFRDPNPAGVVVALDRKTGAVLWKTPMPDAVLGAVAAGPLLLCPVANGEVVALKPADGARVWAARISGNAPILAAPAVVGGEVFAVSQDGYLARLDLKTGNLLEKIYINSTEKPGSQGLSISSPFVANGRVVVGSETGGLRAYAGGAK
jgi:outer membrane protein assembly factor BamB